MDNAQSPVAAPPSPRAVPYYQPSTPDEAVAEEALELTDAEARAEIAMAEDDLTQAVNEFRSARMRLENRA